MRSLWSRPVHSSVNPNVALLGTLSCFESAAGRFWRNTVTVSKKWMTIREQFTLHGQLVIHFLDTVTVTLQNLPAALSKQLEVPIDATFGLTDECTGLDHSERKVT